jgi:hypothetical protein
MGTCGGGDVDQWRMGEAMSDALCDVFGSVVMALVFWWMSW